MIICLASYPKSGNTWVRPLISSYYFSKVNFEFNLEKAQKAVVDSDFKNLSEMEIKKGFNEMSKSQKGSKFFNLGQRNDSEKILPQSIKKSVEKSFNGEMKELGYFN
jgi:hypothetical protein